MDVGSKSRRRAARVAVLLGGIATACSQTEPDPPAPVAENALTAVATVPPPAPPPELASALDRAQGEAASIADPIQRKDALMKVLADKAKFIVELKGSDAAESMRNALPDLYNLIGEAIVEAIKREKDANAVASLRSVGNATFEDAEKLMKVRIAELKAIEKPTEADENALQAAFYNYPRTLYLHSLIFPPGSAKRIVLCKAALVEFDEFDLDYGGGDNPLILTFYAYVDCGLCLKETGKPDEAIKMFEKTISLRESWGPADEKTGVWPIPADARDVIDLVDYATLQKTIVLREMK